MLENRTLIEAATRVRQNAYAKYSHYLVGAALLDEEGAIHVGANVENISFGLTICAERSAISALIASGSKEVRAVAVVTRDGGTPCGMCIQSLLEFAGSRAEEIPVWCCDESGNVTQYSLASLMPHAFKTDL